MDYLVYYIVYSIQYMIYIIYYTINGREKLLTFFIITDEE